MLQIYTALISQCFDAIASRWLRFLMSGYFAIVISNHYGIVALRFHTASMVWLYDAVIL
jgi:hypothetical protein